MSALLNKVKLVHSDLDKAIKDVLTKHGLGVKSSRVSYDDLTINFNLKTFFGEKKEQLNTIENDLGQAMNDLDFKIGDVIKQKHNTKHFVITGFKNNGTILAVKKGVNPESTTRRFRITKRFFHSLEKVKKL